jgi:hypothetical protein
LGAFGFLKKVRAKAPRLWFVFLPHAKAWVERIGDGRKQMGQFRFIIFFFILKHHINILPAYSSSNSMLQHGAKANINQESALAMTFLQ